MPSQDQEREVFVISDLHLGGALPAVDACGGRGFRLMTHPEVLASFVEELGVSAGNKELIINGDFVDFLSEEHEGEKRWRPFVNEEKEAVRIFKRIAQRNSEIFSALASFLQRGKRLTLLLGNHDLELSLPAVRRELELALKASDGQYRFIYDGEAYTVGDALIEHGNRYDPINMVDYDALRQVRSLQSRRSHEGLQEFCPPQGSCLVSSVVNPLKEVFPFVDLLKPESEGLVAVLLALDAGIRRRLPALLWNRMAVPSGALVDDLPMYGGNIAAPGEKVRSSVGGSNSAQDSEEDARLLEILSRCLGEEAGGFLSSVASVSGTASDGQAREFFGEDVASRSLVPRLSVLLLALKGSRSDWRARVGLVRRALRAVDEDLSFDDGVETGRRYLDAAEALSRGGDAEPKYRFIVFGHTHHAKQARLASGAVYLNTGAWADLMRFPPAVFGKDDDAARAALIGFLEDLAQGQLEKYVEFRPTYAHIRLREDGRCEAALRDYDWKEAGQG